MGEHNKDIHVVLVDNQDSFVYNLVDAFAVGGYRCTVFRNTVSAQDVLATNPDLICLSPGPGHPREAGCMMEVIEKADGTIPMLGICLGFQALLEYHGGSVGPCGPVHGITDFMELTQEGLDSPIFADLTTDAGPENNFHGSKVPIARYHSLGCLQPPESLIPLSYCDSEKGKVVMAAQSANKMSIGLQFHPESVLSPQGPVILDRCIDTLLSQRSQLSDAP